MTQSGGSTFTILRSIVANAGTYSLLIRAQSGSITDNSNTFEFVLYSQCEPTGLALSPASVSVSILGPSASVTWSKSANNALCGTYTATATSTSNYNVVISGTTLTISSPNSAVVGNYSLTITVTRDARAQSGTVTLAIAVTPCVVTQLTFTVDPTSETLEVEYDT